MFCSEPKGSKRILQLLTCQQSMSSFASKTNVHAIVLLPVFEYGLQGGRLGNTDRSLAALTGPCTWFAVVPTMFVQTLSKLNKSRNGNRFGMHAWPVAVDRGT